MQIQCYIYGINLDVKRQDFFFSNLFHNFLFFLLLCWFLFSFCTEPGNLISSDLKAKKANIAETMDSHAEILKSPGRIEISTCIDKVKW